MFWASYPSFTLRLAFLHICAHSLPLYLTFSASVGAIGNSLLVVSKIVSTQKSRGKTEAFVHEADKKPEGFPSLVDASKYWVNVSWGQQSDCWIWTISRVIQVRRPHRELTCNVMAPARQTVDIWNPAAWLTAWQQIISSCCFCVGQGVLQDHGKFLNAAASLTGSVCTCVGVCVNQGLLRMEAKGGNFQRLHTFQLHY